MLTTSLYNSYAAHYDFDETSGSIAKFYDQVSKLVSWMAKIKRFVASALFMPIAAIIILVGAVVFIPAFFVVLTLLRFLNRRLEKAVNNENLKLRSELHYLDIREHLQGTISRLERIKSLYQMLQAKNNIILRTPILREIERSIDLIQICVNTYTEALESYDEPLLHGFEDIFVKERDLWNNRTQAYEYML